MPKSHDTSGSASRRDIMSIFGKILRTGFRMNSLVYFTLCLAPLFSVRAESPAADFGALPVQVGGRVQPVDTLARNSLLLLRGTQTVPLSSAEAAFWTGRPSARTPEQTETFRAAGLPVDDKAANDALEKRPVPVSGKTLDADAWLMETAFRPWVGRHFRVFRIDNGEVLALAGIKVADRNRFSWAEIEPKLGDIAAAAAKAGEKESGARSPFEAGVLKLARALERHHMLSTCVFVPGDLSPEVEPLREYWTWLSTLRTASQKLAESKSATSPGKLDEKLGEVFVSLITRYRDFLRESKVGVTPPRTEDELRDGKWANLGGALLDVTRGEPLDRPPVLPLYAEFADAYRRDDDTTALTKLRDLGVAYPDGKHGISDAKLRAELVFNRTQPFYSGLVTYAVAGLLVLAGWIAARRWPLRVAAWLLATGWLVHTAGLITRMWLQGRPPVTNLYSSAVFVGWGAVILGLVVERFWKNGVGSLVASTVGFASLLIAHQLGASGEDSLEVMRAVLDSNFWLATHVVVITFGYSAMFVAGFLAAAAILRRTFDRSFDEASADAVTRAAYGALGFATLASFVGTMLGGIWADQSWGRFWGWDPKENGALLIVLWCALVLHARLGGLVKRPGFLQLLVAGNIVTAWSWFGTNMLGVGLHSYGFTDSAFVALIAFVTSQVVLIALGWLPAKAPVRITRDTPGAN